MSTPATTQSPLLRLPRELRDQIYTYTFLEYRFFSDFPPSWSDVDTSDKNALFRALPGVCQASRQLFDEATPVFLARDMQSWNTSTSKQLLNLYSQFPEDTATKGIQRFSIHNWTEQGTAVQLNLISKFTNLQFLHAIFSFPSIVDGVPLERFNYPNEQGIWLDTGLHYDPPPGRSIEEEKAVLKDDLEAFITRYSLDRIVEMPGLNSMQFIFATNDRGENAIGGNKEYRHRLCNPLWRWATQKMVEKWGEEIGRRAVTTTLPEDYERVNMMGS
jgi:hypothetical protein